MLKNYIKIAIRNLWRAKGFSFINIFGLAIGMACSLLIFLFVKDETSYDRFHQNADRLYRVVKDFVNDDGTRLPNATTPPALGASVANIVGLLSKDFLKLVLIALVIAIPVDRWAMNKWLEDFVYRINIE